MAKTETRLLKTYHSLSNENRDNLLAYAEFLLSRQEPESDPVPDAPLDIPRPDDESVVAAIRRLRTTYPMVRRDLVFTRSSELMSSHIMHGHEASAVIDELEQLFLGHFRGPESEPEQEQEQEQRPNQGREPDQEKADDRA